MKFIKTSCIAFAVLMIAACGTSKKAATTTAATPPPPPSPPASTDVPFFLAPPPSMASDVIAPGDKELAAIQARYKDATMQTLTDGHAIYTGECTKCHGAKSIYKRSEEQWPGIIDDMALRAHITDAQKDALSKYVLAIKATQPK